MYELDHKILQLHETHLAPWLIMYTVVEYPKHQDFSGNHQLVAELD